MTQPEVDETVDVVREGDSTRVASSLHDLGSILGIDLTTQSLEAAQYFSRVLDLDLVNHDKKPIRVDVEDGWVWDNPDGPPGKFYLLPKFVEAKKDEGCAHIGQWSREWGVQRVVEDGTLSSEQAGISDTAMLLYQLNRYRHNDLAHVTEIAEQDRYYLYDEKEKRLSHKIFGDAAGWTFLANSYDEYHANFPPESIRDYSIPELQEYEVALLRLEGSQISAIVARVGHEIDARVILKQWEAKPSVQEAEKRGTGLRDWWNYTRKVEEVGWGGDKGSW